MMATAAVAFLAIFCVRRTVSHHRACRALIGYLGGQAGSPLFRLGGRAAVGNARHLDDAQSVLGEATPAHAQPDLRWSLTISATLLALWLLPVAALVLPLGPDNVFSQIAVFFSQMAVVTFGGAYAVLAYVAQEAVQNYGWLMPGEMLDGLGMAETTPGPLDHGRAVRGFPRRLSRRRRASPHAGGALAAILTTWVTFVPCFLWIFLGAPFIEQLRGNSALTGALSADHGCGGRGHRQSGGLVRGPRAVRADADLAGLWHEPRCAGVVIGQPAGAGLGRRWRRWRCFVSMSGRRGFSAAAHWPVSAGSASANRQRGAAGPAKYTPY